MANAPITDMAPDYESTGENAKAPLKLWLRLFSCANLIEGEIGRRLRTAFDISLARFDFMAQLYRSGEGGMTMSQLGHCLMVTGGNITGLTDRLEKEGLAARQPHPTDRRSQVIALTPRGRKAFEKIARAHEAWVRELVGDIDAETHDELMHGLGTLKDQVLRQAAEKGT